MSQIILELKVNKQKTINGKTKRKIILANILNGRAETKLVCL